MNSIKQLLARQTCVTLAAGKTWVTGSIPAGDNI